MKYVLICAGERAEVSSLSAAAPLSNVPLLGQSLLEYWLSHLACSGAKSVIILAHDRPEFVEQTVGDGARWGLNAKVVPESRELAPAQALLKYPPEPGQGAPPDAIALMDHFPGHPGFPLFTGYAAWFDALRNWLPHALTPDRVGIRQVRPGIWAGVNSRISSQANLQPPCWLGQHVFIGANAHIGPGAIVEDGTFVEPAAEVVESWVGPDTFVGQFARIAKSVAFGATLVRWETGSMVQVPDPFLMCALRKPRRLRGAGLLSRLSELYARNREEAVLKQLLIHKQG
jgi:NDP-sugar pyrophosphorylase family protein